MEDNALSNIHSAERITESLSKATAIAWKLLRNWNQFAEAREVESIVSLSLCQAAKTYDCERDIDFLTYAYYFLKGNLFRSIIQDEARRKKYFQSLEDFDESSQHVSFERFPEHRQAFCPETLLIQFEEITFLKKCLFSLSPLQQRILHESFWNNSPLETLSESINMPRTTVWRLKQRALRSLKQRWLERKRVGSEEREKVV